MISVVTPTLNRPQEIAGLLENLRQQNCLPSEWIIVDAAPDDNTETAEILQMKIRTMEVPFPIIHIRHGGGTAIQRNIGLEKASGDYIAFVDDDIRLDDDFFEQMQTAFASDNAGQVGGITGYITNQYLNPEKSPHWRWNKRLRLLTTYEPGRYDYQSGSPVNRYLQPPHDSLREIDFMGAGCAVWRRGVFENGLRFSVFFTGYGVLEDAHFALRAKKEWILLENGKARCVHLHAQSSRVDNRNLMRLAAINHRFVFVDIVPKRSWLQEFRFWRLQVFDFLRIFVYAVLNRKRENWLAVLGKLEGMWLAWRLQLPETKTL